MENNEKKVKKFYKEFNLKKHAGKRGFKELKIILPWIKGKKKILDLACGYGRISIPLVERGFEVYGVDISQNLIEQAKQEASKKKVKIEFKVGKFTEIPYPDEFFEGVIIIWSSFCHLLTKTEQIRALKEIKRVLTSGGVVLIDIPYYNKFVGLELFKKEEYQIPMFRFNKVWLKQISKSAGFKKIKIVTSEKENRKRNLVILEK